MRYVVHKSLWFVVIESRKLLLKFCLLPYVILKNAGMISENLTKGLDKWRRLKGKKRRERLREVFIIAITSTIGLPSLSSPDIVGLDALSVFSSVARGWGVLVARKWTEPVSSRLSERYLTEMRVGRDSRHLLVAISFLAKALALRVRAVGMRKFRRCDQCVSGLRQDISW